MNLYINMNLKSKIIKSIIFKLDNNEKFIDFHFCLLFIISMRFFRTKKIGGYFEPFIRQESSYETIKNVFN